MSYRETLISASAQLAPLLHGGSAEMATSRADALQRLRCIQSMQSATTRALTSLTELSNNPQTSRRSGNAG